MCYVSYIRKMVEKNDRIYIDTCSLLDTERLYKFLEISKSIFIELDKKMIVHMSVMKEIENFIDSDNFYKREKAGEVLRCIKENPKIFSIEDCQCVEQTKVFADPDILQEIASKKLIHTQLLISNDNALTEAAFAFNNLRCCKTKPVNVCFINSQGHLQMCNCVFSCREYEPVVQEKIVVKPVEKIVEVEKEVPQKQSLWKKGLTVVLSFTGGCVFTGFLCSLKKS